MGFFTENEWDTFDFGEAHIAELRFGLGSFYLLLDNVKILEKNSCNRDVRTMRTNSLEFRISEPQIVAVIEEGYKVYNADGVLQQEIPDRAVELEEYGDVCEQLEDAVIDELRKEDDVYVITASGEGHVYTLQVKGNGDSEEWKRFMNLAEI